MTHGVSDMIANADRAVARITPVEARRCMAEEDALVVDVRDAPEIARTGKVLGALHVPRGMLEFRADPASAYHDARFDRAKTLILYCTSGGRSALGAKTLKEMGYRRVFNLGAFKDWVESGGAVEGAV